MAQQSDDRFFDTVPRFAEFDGVADAANYRALPEDWALATSDIVSSTEAIAGGRYKAVNMAGASVISAILNASGIKDLPFVFGGDGALVAVPGSAEAKTRQALAAVRTWVKEELDLDMRAAMVPMGDIRARGLDVRVARFGPSDHVSYAMFTGGGASWAEAEMKAGRYAVPPAPAGARPDLTGLSCRWNPIEARNGEIVSIIATPGDKGAGKAFQELVADIIHLAGEQARDGHPVPDQGLEFSFPPAGLDIEARASAPKGLRLLKKASIIVQMALGIAAGSFGRKIGRWDAKLYKRDVADNSDFRKFDDGLKMTIDIPPDRLGRIEQRLEEAGRAGICRYGLHRQGSALMTCLVASPFQRDHMHFIDGAAGGYAMAASHLKERAAA